MIPTYLKDTFKVIENDDYLVLQLQSKNNNTYEILYYETLEEDGNNLYVSSIEYDTPIVLIARNIQTDEMILLFDQNIHGYKGLFVTEYSDKERLLDAYPSKPIKDIIITLGQSIDYKSEKEDYDFDDEGKVILVDQRHVEWDEAIKDGFDYINIKIVDSDNQTFEILDEELA